MDRYTAADFQSDMQGPSPRTEELAYLQARLGPVEELLRQSQTLEGIVFTERGAMDVEAALEAFDVGPVRYRFGTWVVTDSGIACLVRHYPIAEEHLAGDHDWASLLAEQDWPNLWDLLRTLAVARHSARPQTSDRHGGASYPS